MKLLPDYREGLRRAPIEVRCPRYWEAPILADYILLRYCSFQDALPGGIPRTNLIDRALVDRSNHCAKTNFRNSTNRYQFVKTIG